MRCFSGPVFQSTLSVRRATQVKADFGLIIGISIHALREESDVSYSSKVLEKSLFQSTLSVRRATQTIKTYQTTKRFQSTLSVRRATGRIPGLQELGCISIHALREESDGLFQVFEGVSLISIHALREESDKPGTTPDTEPDAFQSTLSVRRATEDDARRIRQFDISIHALREESDTLIREVKGAN